MTFSIFKLCLNILIFVDYLEHNSNDIIPRWVEKLPLSKSSLESTWLYHEIGRCYLEMGQYTDAREYGEKSIAAAKEAEDEGWQLHATVLVAQAEGKFKVILTILYTSTG